MKFLVLAIAAFTIPTLSQAETVGFFPSAKKGVVLVQDGKSADGEFFWNLLAVEAVDSGSDYTKKFESRVGDFKAVCKRAKNTPTPLTSCTLTFADVQYGGVVVIDKEEQEITGIYNQEIADAFELPQELVRSPDGLLLICSACGSGEGLPFSITWKK